MRFLLLLFFCCCFCLDLSSQEPVPVIIPSDLQQIQIGGQHLFYAEDKSRTKTTASLSELTFKAVDGLIPNFGFVNSSYWFQFKLQNTSTRSMCLMLEIKNPNLDYIQVTELLPGGDTVNHQLGDFFPFYQRPVPERYFQLPLSLLPNSTHRYILNVRNSGEQFHVPIAVGSNEYFTKKNETEKLYYGIYFGLIIFALFINTFFYLVLKNTYTLYYIAFIFTLLFLQLSLTGIGFEYLWPESVYLANHANPIFANLSIFFFLKFCLDFLNTSYYLPGLYKWLNWLWYLILIPTILAFTNTQALHSFSIVSINVIALGLNILIIPWAIITWKKNFQPARFFTLAFILLIIGVFLFILKNFGLTASYPIADYGLQIGSGCEVILLTLAVVDRFKKFKDDALLSLEEVNILKTEANTLLEKKVEERTREINMQKLEIEEKSNEILSSIRYAKRIQEALLPPAQVMDKLFKNYFIFYEPRDIVSGDFYWASSVNTTLSGNSNKQLSLLAVADCTGHGVPGAFMSLIGTNFLKQSLTEPSINSPAQALDFVNQKIIHTLNQQWGENRVRDGMDISLIAIDYTAKKLQFSGANNSLYIVRKGELTVLEADKQAIGSVSEEINNFNNHYFQLVPGDCIYLFTDGYADQFGGEKGKKLMYKKFRDILVQISSLPIMEQQKKLQQEFLQWKGSYEQIDDVCVVGIKVEE